MPKLIFGIDIDLGISHADDRFIMYRQSADVENQKTTEDAKMSRKLISMWTRFAATGKLYFIST